MNIPDLFFLITAPIGLFSSIWDTRRMIIMRSAKARSISSYALAWLLVASFTLRAWVSLGDIIFTVYGLLLLLFNGFQLGVILYWRKQ